MNRLGVVVPPMYIRNRTLDLVDLPVGANMAVIDRQMAGVLAQVGEDITSRGWTLTSSYRSVLDQEVLVYLGYPAIEFGYHQLGLAVDFKNSDLNDRADNWFKSLDTNSLQDLSLQLGSDFDWSKFSEVVLPSDIFAELKVIDDIFRSAGLTVIDETGIFSTQIIPANNSSGYDLKLSAPRPTLHIQFTPSD